MIKIKLKMCIDFQANSPIWFIAEIVPNAAKRDFAQNLPGFLISPTLMLKMKRNNSTYHEFCFDNFSTGITVRLFLCLQIHIFGFLI